MSLYSSSQPSSLKQVSLKHIMIDCVSIEGTYTHISKRALCMHPHWHACMHSRLVITRWIPSAQLYTFSVAAKQLPYTHIRKPYGRFKYTCNISFCTALVYLRFIGQLTVLQSNALLLPVDWQELGPVNWVRNLTYS